MTISVIIPTFNEEKILAQALVHVSTLSFDEILVVDGGSTDRTVKMAEAFCARVSNARTLISPRGRARQMNEGAEASRGTILLFLHADTQLPPRARESIEAALADPAIVGGRFDVRFDRPSAWGRMISALMNWRSRLSGIATGDQAIFVRRQTFEEAGGFADIPLMEDIDLCRRLKRLGRLIALRDTVTTSFRRWDTHGPLRTIILMWSLRVLYWAGVSPHRLARLYTTAR
jgi:rSAM/selenodomain-associated transferase 2